MKVEHTPCYILHRRDYSESSLILEVFSREYGRVNLLAKGAKRNKKQQADTFNLYQEYNIAWSAKSELGTLIDIEPLGAETLNPGLMMTGFYMNEVLLRLLHKDEPHPDLYDSYKETIYELMNGEPEQIVLRYYEKNLLQSLGYGVILDHEVETGGNLISENDYFYKYDFGPVLKKHTDSLGMIVSGKTLIEIDTESLIDTKNIKEAKILLGTILEQHLGNKPLASKSLYKSFIKHKKKDI